MDQDELLDNFFEWYIQNLKSRGSPCGKLKEAQREWEDSGGVLHQRLLAEKFSLFQFFGLQLVRLACYIQAVGRPLSARVLPPEASLTAVHNSHAVHSLRDASCSVCPYHTTNKRPCSSTPTYPSRGEQSLRAHLGAGRTSWPHPWEPGGAGV